MMKTLSVALLPFLVFFGNGSFDLLTGLNHTARKANTGLLEKMMVSSGSVSMEVSMTRLNGVRSGAKAPQSSVLRFDAERNSFFTILVFNGELRGPLPGTLGIVSQEPSALPAGLKEAENLVVENVSGGAHYELIVRDAASGKAFFNIEGHQYGYDPGQRLLSIEDGRLLLTKEYAAELGRPSDAGTVVGRISINATMHPIEVAEIIDGQVVSDVLPAISEELGGVPGPDVIVGNVMGLAQFGSASGGQVGLAVGTDSCNAGVVDLNWFALPNNDHPVIPQNMYRMSGGASNDERFEQIGQSNVKHAFTALTQNLCGFGCNGVGGSRLGSGCSDPYSASLNAGPSLGSRAWINPYTGFYPRGDSATPPNSHSGHSHTGPSHRILTNIDDLNTNLNPGATYYAEAQYVTPHEYAWCQANPGECNMNNNVSYREYNVSGTTTSFSFSPDAATVREAPAISAWPGATLVPIEPDPGNDGIGTVAYKVTNPSPGVWHYEYAIFNQNIDRAIGSFSVPITGAVLSNIGFHAPPQHPGWSADGTVGNTGFSSAPWDVGLTSNTVAWSTETFAANQNANAIRWGTMYNFRFDSDSPPQETNATIGFFKTGEPIVVPVMAPGAAVSAVSVSGRVMSQEGRGVANARVSITDSMGNARIAVTSPFGFYRFDSVVTGETYTFAVAAKRYAFTPQDVPVTDAITDLNFVANP
jgi:hypothetical protein